MASATFEEHPTDPNRVILRKKPRLDQGADYERGFIDGMQYQMQSSVDKAVNAMSRTWVGLTQKERDDVWYSVRFTSPDKLAVAIEAKLKEKNT